MTIHVLILKDMLYKDPNRDILTYADKSRAERHGGTMGDRAT